MRDEGTEASIREMTQVLFLRPEQRIVIDEWRGCYDGNWKGLIVEEAFVHPAKFSRALIAKMYEHAKAEGWVFPGATVLDPFGGVGLGALEAMKHGCLWVGCELEPKFHDLGNKNITYWNGRFQYLPGWGTARLVQGDSRKLSEILSGQADVVCSSPPFLDDLAKVSKGGIGSSQYGRQEGKFIVERRLLLANLDHSAFGSYLKSCREALNLSKSEVDRAMGTNTAYSFWEGRTGSQDQWRVPLPAMYRKLKTILQLDDRFDNVLLSTEMVEIERHALAMGHKEIDYGTFPGQLGAMKEGSFSAVVSSPPFLQTGVTDHKGQTSALLRKSTVHDAKFLEKFEYGTSPGQLGAMKEGRFDSVISSPPFLGARSGTTASGETSGGGPCAERIHTVADGNRLGQAAGQLADMKEGDFDLVCSSPPFNENKSNAIHGQTKGVHSYDENEAKSRMKRDYVMGEHPASLGNLPAGEFDSVVSSPPYEASATNGERKNRAENLEKAGIDSKAWLGERRCTQGRSPGYGNADGQLGRDQGPTFWSAAREIVEQCHLLLKPGGVAMWVVKGFVRKGQLVDFPHQWQQLCESVGFKLLHEHHAMLTTELDEQFHLDGTSTKRTVERKSFFRRLAEKKGSPRIDYETVLCMVK